MPNSTKGFTLIEIILVVSIVTILSAMSAAFYSSFLTQNAVANTTDQIVSELRKAQLYSMMSRQSGGTWGVKYTTSPQQITLFLQGNSAFDENFTVNNNITVSPSFNLTFNHLTGSAAGATFPYTITVTGNNTTKTITINSEGVVSQN